MDSNNPTFTPEELANEEWRPVVGYEGVYSISCHGRVRREGKGHGVKPGRILRPKTNDNGYQEVNLSKHNIARMHKIHALVANAFLGECPNGHEVNHKDTIKSNNRVENLEYCTHHANMLHSLLNGRYCTGERVWSSLFTEQDVRTIRSLYAQGVRQCEIARRFNANQKAIHYIVRQKTWKHVA
jgi:hypothetical protein